MDTQKLKAFFTAAKLGSYAKASQTLSENPSTVRSWIISLEKELNVSLFMVKNKKLLLTKSGEKFIPYAEKILNTLDSTLSQFQGIEKNMEGDFNIATTHDIANVWLASSLKEFLIEYPQTNVQISASEDQLPFSSNKFDAYITTHEFNRKDIIQHQLMEYNMQLYASEEYIKKEGMPKDIEELQKHRIIEFDTSNPCPYENINWHLEFFPESFQSYVKVNSNISILQFVEEGIGIGAVSQFEAKKSSVKLIKILQNECKGIKIPVYLRYPESKSTSQKIVNLKKYLTTSVEKILA